MNCCSTLFTTVYKRLPEGGRGAFCLLPWAFAFCFQLFSVGSFWKGKIAEGKKIAKGEWLKRGR
jgi:hypothetical protein